MLKVQKNVKMLKRNFYLGWISTSYSTLWFSGFQRKYTDCGGATAFIGLLKPRSIVWETQP